MAMEAPASKDLSVIHCPMAKADWVQQPGETANPYMGPEMRQCGSVTKQVQSPPADSPLSKMTTAYLAYEKGLMSDRVDSMAASQLKAATAQLQGNVYDKLREAIDKLAGTKELEPARQQFKTVSEAVIALLMKQQKSS
jgi:hypothetical protein